MTGVGESKVADSQREIGPQCREGVPELMAPFDPQQGADLSIPVRFFQSLSGGSDFKSVGMLFDEQVGNIDLFERISDSPSRLAEVAEVVGWKASVLGTGNKHGPEELVAIPPRQRDRPRAQA